MDKKGQDKNEEEKRELQVGILDMLFLSFSGSEKVLDSYILVAFLGDCCFS